MGSLDGKVAFITGAGRGQGRSHAVRMAEEGANIIAVDVCKDIPLLKYSMASSADLQETVRLVKAAGGRVIGIEADVRDVEAMNAAAKQGFDAFGRIDIIIANAGIAAQQVSEDDPSELFNLTLAINAFGVRNTVHAAVPYTIEAGNGGSVVITSSTQGLHGRGGNGSGAGDGYVASKHAVVGLMRSWAHWLAPHMIRVNTIHPTGVDTYMITNPAFQDYVKVMAGKSDGLQNLMPVPVVHVEDITNAVMYLVSDTGRFVTGVTLPVDAGFNVR